MNNTNTNGPAREWLRQMADYEDSCRSVSVGGMAADLGMLQSSHAETGRIFGRLIALARRKKNLSVEQLAQQADIDLAEAIEIESDETTTPTARTVHQLAAVLGLPSLTLMEVAGLASPRPDVSSAALKFAARCEPTAHLSAEEREALDEFVKVLGNTVFSNTPAQK